jgi:hypothetical protein
MHVATEQTILRTLENEMETRGYQKVPAAQAPDLVMTAAAAFQETHFHFGLAPEIGVFFQNPVGAVFLNARSNMAFAAGGVPFQQFLSINLGYAWEHSR